MTTAQSIALACQRTFGRERWEGLTADQRRAVIADVDAIDQDECVQGIDHDDAARILRNRIGGVNSLAGYADCLLAGERRRSAKGDA